MSKIALVAKREFLSRVQKKTFLLTTISLPLIIFGFYALIIYFSIKSDSGLSIAVADEANVFKDSLENKDDLTFHFIKGETKESLRSKVQNGVYDAYVFIPKETRLLYNDSISIVSGKTVGLTSRSRIEDIINNRLHEQRLLALNISKDQLDSAQKGSSIRFHTLKGSEDSEAKMGISYGVGYISGFLIYIILFIYGTMVMRGVMEEKMNRIAEVIVSSVKPFQLMMGKITGIGAVGLLQFIIWIVLVIGLQFLLPLIFPSLSGHAQQMPMQPGGAMQANAGGAMDGIMKGLDQINFPVIIICFIIYFLGGYLLYSSLFAAVGSSVNEDPQDAQSLMLPITMPIIFSIVIMTRAVQDPSGGLAVFGSLFPLTSPVVMMARIAHGVPDVVPYWQLLLSIALLILGFLGTTWLAGKIYRTGILMYGKKPTWKELMKWAFRKSA